MCFIIRISAVGLKLELHAVPRKRDKHKQAARFLDEAHIRVAFKRFDGLLDCLGRCARGKARLKFFGNMNADLRPFARGEKPGEDALRQLFCLNLCCLADAEQVHRVTRR